MEKLHRKALGIRYLLLYIACSFFIKEASSQETTKTVIAGKQYGTSSFQQWRWGRHYRKEWTTPVQFHILILDTAFGGLVPYQGGGGRQSKS